MSTSRRLRIAGFALVLFLCVSGCFATNLRGRVSGVVSATNYRYALVGIPVDLYWYNAGLYNSATGQNGVWQRLLATRTDSYGMYYLQGVNPGSYVIQINGRSNYDLVVHPPPHNAPLRMQDIAEIFVYY